MLGSFKAWLAAVGAFGWIMYSAMERKTLFNLAATVTGELMIVSIAEIWVSYVRGKKALYADGDISLGSKRQRSHIIMMINKNL